MIDRYNVLKEMAHDGNLTPDEFIEYKNLKLTRCTICDAEYPKYRVIKLGKWFCENCIKIKKV